MNSPVTVEMARLMKKNKKFSSSVLETNKMTSEDEKTEDYEPVCGYNHFVLSHDCESNCHADKYTAIWVTGSNNILVIESCNEWSGNDQFNIFCNGGRIDYYLGLQKRRKKNLKTCRDFEIELDKKFSTNFASNFDTIEIINAANNQSITEEDFNRMLNAAQLPGRKYGSKKL
ncbi:MAG: hypothetical protein GY870_04950 [archaeon]|nr:hypothetical protein [archaeon]